MINGIMTLSGAWHKLRTDPILKFMIVALSFYGMSTFEGPMMSIKTVNALSHYTNWTIGHVHSGALGWVAMMTMGSIYCLLPRSTTAKACTAPSSSTCISGRRRSVSCCTSSMWVAGVTEGLMWRAVNADGTLTYSFVEILKAKYPYYGCACWAGSSSSPACSSWPTTSGRRSANRSRTQVAVMEPA